MTTKYKVITDFGLRISYFRFRITDFVLRIFGLRVTDFGPVGSVGRTADVNKKPSKINK